MVYGVGSTLVTGNVDERKQPWGNAPRMILCTVMMTLRDIKTLVMMNSLTLTNVKAIKSS